MSHRCFAQVKSAEVQRASLTLLEYDVRFDKVCLYSSDRIFLTNRMLRMFILFKATAALRLLAHSLTPRHFHVLHATMLPRVSDMFSKIIIIGFSKFD